MIILSSEECPQGSDQWLLEKLGKPSSSHFREVLTPAGKVSTGRAYMNNLLSEWLTGKKSSSYQSKDMIRGSELEVAARDDYGFTKGYDPVEVGLVYLDERKLVLYSPDALINDDGGWECKSLLDQNHVDILLANEMPIGHKPQVQGCLWICEREWWDFMSYSDTMKPMIKRIYRDEDYIRKLKSAVDDFVDEMLEKREKLSHMRAA